MPDPLHPGLLGRSGHGEDRLRLIADAVPAFIAYIDQEQRYRVVNRTYEEQFGRSGQDLLGRTAAEILGLRYAALQPRLAAALAGTPQRFESRIDTARGERSLDVSYIPDRDSEGHVHGIIVHGVDITERCRVEEELRSSHQWLRLALTAANGVGVWDWDLSTGLIRADATFARLYGVDPAEAERGAPFATFSRNMHPDDLDHVEKAIATAIATGSEYVVEYRVLQADGPVRWVAARGRCTYAPDGTPANLPGVVLDITDRKRQEDALRQTEKLAAVGRLASSIAHEINNPLESVVNLLYLIETSTHEDPNQLATYAQLAQQELARISQISTQTLRFFKQSTAPVAASLAELAASVLALYQGRLANSRIHIEPRIRYETTVLCYEGEIRQVLNNLVGNAMDAMRETGGRLLLRARPATDPAGTRTGVRITVADTGHGMEPSTLRNIFEPFFTTKGALGTGLGLWVSSGIVSKHGGRLRARSSTCPAHHGAVFSLFLPDFPAM